MPAPPPRRLPPSIPPMKAIIGELPPEDGSWAYEVKWDGVRATGFIEGGTLRLQSTNLLDITPRYPELAPIVDQLGGQDAILDGEIVTFDEEGRPSFGLLQSRMHLSGARAVAEMAARQPVVWVLFDLLHLNGHDLFVPASGSLPAADRDARLKAVSAFTYENRRKLLDDLVEPGPNWQVPPCHRSDGAGLLDAVATKGLEGIVAKRTDSLYEAGRRSPAWRKIKVRREQELVVGGWKAGEGSRSGSIGSLLVGYHDDDGRFVYGGKVGSGLTAGEIDALTGIFAGLRRDTCPFDPPPERAEQRGATWVEPKLVVQVAFGEWSRDGRLRHPTYLGRRSDKDPADVVREPG